MSQNSQEMPRWEQIKSLVLFMLNRLVWLLVIGLVTNTMYVSLFMTVEHRSFGDSLWWGWVTGFTVGYGDISPVTLLGRLIAVCAMGTDFILLACFSGQITAMVIINKHILTDAEQELYKIRLEEQSFTLHAIHTILANGGRIDNLPPEILEVRPFRTDAQIMQELELRETA